MKPTLPRKAYINQTAVQTVSIERLGAELWEYSNALGAPCAIAFSGKKQKPDWHYRFQNDNQRALKVKDWLKNLEEHAAYFAERKIKRTVATSLQVGDILYASWGYDQTNIDFYQVTGRKGTRGVYVRHITSHQVDGTQGFMSAHVLPNSGDFNGPETYHQATNDSIKVDVTAHYPNSQNDSRYRHHYASKWNGTPVYESWYA